MPKPVNGRMGGFQLWVNLPRKYKMMDPRYQEIRAEEIPMVMLPGGGSARVICGKLAGVTGPVRDLMADPEYIDVSLGPEAKFSHPVKPGYLAAVYVIGGKGSFDLRRTEDLVNRTIALFGNEGESVEIHAGSEGVRFL
jgi:redox-sensitive bicupin YhaK (pirin superfamily)